MLIARQAGTAIINARAFETERRELARAQFAAAVARAALAASGLEEGANAVLGVVAQACPTSGMTISVIAADARGERRHPATASHDGTADSPRLLSSGERARGELLVRDQVSRTVRGRCPLADPSRRAATLHCAEEPITRSAGPSWLRARVVELCLPRVRISSYATRRRCRAVGYAPKTRSAHQQPFGPLVTRSTARRRQSMDIWATGQGGVRSASRRHDFPACSS